MTARIATPPDKVIAIYMATGIQKEIAHRFGVTTGAVANIKALNRHRKTIERHLADLVRAESAMLATMACCPNPRALVAWGVS